MLFNICIALMTYILGSSVENANMIIICTNSFKIETASFAYFGTYKIYIINGI